MTKPQFRLRTKLRRQVAFTGGKKEMIDERNELAALVRDSTDKNRQFFVVYIGLWLYVLLMVFATTDQMLLVPTQGIKLPLVDVTLPLLGFYLVAPLLLLAIHFNLLQNLESHHFKLMRWRDACGGEVPRKRIPAFLFDFEWLERGSRLELLVRFISRILFLHSGPLAIGIVLWRFTDYQNIWITAWHLILFVVDVILVRGIEKSFQKDRQPVPDFPALTARLLASCFGVLILLQFVIACWFQTEFSPDEWKMFERLRTFKNGPQIERTSSWQSSIFFPIITIEPNVKAWLPEKEEIEAQALLFGAHDVAQWWLQHGEGLDLAGRHLRGFSAIDANLPKLRLNESDLQGANLSGAYLQGANLSGARVQSVLMGGADLQGAILHGAELRWVDLNEAKLQGADLSNVVLDGANLWGAQMQGVDLSTAQLRGAVLVAANLQGANLSGALLQAANLSSSQLQGADLIGANLNVVDLSGAQMQGANMTGAKLQGAIVAETAFQQAVLPDMTDVVYVDPAFSMSRAAWSAIGDLPLTFSKSLSRHEYLRRIEGAKNRTSLTEWQVQRVLRHRPELIWSEIIPSLDRDGNLDNQQIRLELSGLKSNYAQFESMEIYRRVNRAFCDSRYLTEFCERSFKDAIFSKTH